MWAVINPIATIAVYTFIFSEVMQAKLPNLDQTWAYSVYLCSGLLTWQYFVETIQRLQNVFVEQNNIIKKVSFPKVTLPIYVMLSSTLNFSIVFIVFLVFLAGIGHFPGLEIIWVLPLFIIQQSLALGIGLMVGTLNVFFRDFGHFSNIFIQFWFWFTPIVYTIQIVPDKFKSIISINFIIPIFQSYQSLFLYNKVPNWEELKPVVLITVVLLGLAYMIFQKLKNEMVDEL